VPSFLENETLLGCCICSAVVLQRGGFFVECGALDGERSSNTLYLERDLGWTGLLIEADPYFYTQLLGHNRNVWSINACLSPYSYVTSVSCDRLFCLCVRSFVLVNAVR